MAASCDQLKRTRDHQQSILDALPDLRFELGLDGRYHDFHTIRTDSCPPETLLEKTVPEVLSQEEASEKERRLVARELHDALGQMLTAGSYGSLHVKAALLYEECVLLTKSYSPCVSAG